MTPKCRKCSRTLCDCAAVFCDYQREEEAENWCEDGCDFDPEELKEAKRKAGKWNGKV